MIVTLSEKLARAYLESLEHEGVAASLEVFERKSPDSDEKSIAVMVVPLNGFYLEPYELIVQMLAKLIQEGYSPPPPADDDEPPAGAPSGNTGPNFAHRL